MSVNLHCAPNAILTHDGVRYVCVAFLTTFSKELKQIAEFQDLIMFLQRLPTKGWHEKEVALLLAEAYRLEFTFQDAKNHLQ